MSSGDGSSGRRTATQGPGSDGPLDGNGRLDESLATELSGVESGLKDFQKATVDYVFRRMYRDPDYTRRFLIADEVGLGKTLVARGIIARAIRELWEDIERIDVVYICSNGDIARQNINRLNVLGDRDFDLASRLTLLPIQLSGLRDRKLNFVALTPGTSFNLRSSMGKKEERALLYWLLKEPFQLEGAAPFNVLQGYVTDWRAFRSYVRGFPDRHDIDVDLAGAFAARLRENERRAHDEGRSSLRQRFDEACSRFPRARDDVHDVPDEDRRIRRRIIGDLRSELAQVCIDELEPDIVILDEFQRFKDLLGGDSEAALLARELFEYSDEVAQVRVLLLSATPYKMYTLSGESGDDDHYRDFLDTLDFLFDDPDSTRRLARLLTEYRRALYRADGDSLEELRQTKRKIENILRSVMVRTERLGSSKDRNGMLREVSDTMPELSSGDVRSYLALQRLAGELGHSDTMAYWKAAPYLLTFMEGYKLKEKFDAAVERSEISGSLLEAVGDGDGLALPWKQIRQYEGIELGNPRLRSLSRDVVERGAWQLLWIPPSFPYHQPSGPFGRPALRAFTKRLVFSAWRVVPKAIATLLSYETERRIVQSWDPAAENTQERRKRHHTPLQFTESGGRLTGMPVLGVLYPSTTLARLCDPLEISGAITNRASLEREKSSPDRSSLAEGEPVSSEAFLPSAESVMDEAHRRVQDALVPVIDEHAGEGPVDEAWYWAAPLLLDRARAPRPTADWWERRGLAGRWTGGDEGDEGSRFADHVGEARAAVEGRIQLGAPPDDLAQVVALTGLAGPSVAALRSLGRVLSPDSFLSGTASDRKRSAAESADGRGPDGRPPESIPIEDVEVRDLAVQVGWSFRSLLNPPEAVALIRGWNDREPYWRRVLEYGVAGNLQSVLDEYVHVLKEALGHVGAADLTVARTVAEKVMEVLGLRTVSLRTDEVSTNGKEGTIHVHRTRMRAHFAHRFGDESGSEEQAGHRADQLRWAFNSPFWPFVLATTSVGQEGLDFHTYCHAIVHWNLPSNPVDMEQREGRIHRYKGHAVRKNLAADFGMRVLDGGSDGGDGTGVEPSPLAMDPWSRLFRHGEEAREPGQTELVPYWVYPGRDPDNGARIERHVPTLPFSRDSVRLGALRRSLAVYRMVFGQPRQEDLMEFLMKEFGQDKVEELLDELRVDLGVGVS